MVNCLRTFAPTTEYLSPVLRIDSILLYSVIIPTVFATITLNTVSVVNVLLHNNQSCDHKEQKCEIDNLTVRYFIMNEIDGTSKLVVIIVKVESTS